MHIMIRALPIETVGATALDSIIRGGTNLPVLGPKRGTLMMYYRKSKKASHAMVPWGQFLKHYMCLAIQFAFWLYFCDF